MINGLIMSGDIPVAEVENNNVTILDEDLVPLFFKKYNDIEQWLQNRAIDSSRTNARLLKKALRLNEKDDISTVLSVNAVTLTDNYWFKGENEKDLKWKDVKFNKNEFDLVALNGDINGFFKQPSRTPELTNIGSFEKCWKLENNKWWLYKKESKEELFSELFTFYLGKELNFPMAVYEYDKEGYIKSLDFTIGNELNYESAYSIMRDNEDYNDNFKCLQEIDKEYSTDLAEDYIKMIYLDTIVFNMDRHTHNFGILRDSSNGEICLLAPNFDNNIALISRGYPKDVNRKNDYLISLFKNFISNNKEAFKILDRLDIPIITKDLLNNVIKQLPEEIVKEIDTNTVKEFVLNGSNKVRNTIQDLIEEEEL